MLRPPRLRPVSWVSRSRPGNVFNRVVPVWCQRADLRKLRLSYIREDRILPHLPALHLQLTDPTTPQRRRRTRRGLDTRPQASPEDVIRHLREHRIALTYDPASGSLAVGTDQAAQTITVTAS